MANTELNEPDGPGTMHGLDGPPASPTSDTLKKIEAQGPPPSSFSDTQPKPAGISFEDYEPETGAPKAPTLEALSENEKRLKADGPPTSPTSDSIKKMEAEGPPPSNI